MKRKLLSLLLVITLLAITVSTGLPTILAENENLITNGDFADYSGNTPDNWKLDLNSAAGGTAEIVEDVQLAEGVKANALKVSTANTSTAGQRSTFRYTNTIDIEKNATYTMTFWVKSRKIKGLRGYMYEPDYIDLNGVSKHNDHADEGQNIYTYTYKGTDNNGNPTTRVSRSDIEHSWNIAGNTTANLEKVSMFIVRTGYSSDTDVPLTPDFPATTREGEWTQVIHTFATGNTEEHTAKVSYEFAFPSIEGGEIWFAGFNMNVVKAAVDDYFNPKINDVKLGVVSPSKDIPLIDGKDVELIAEPFGENKFDGWYSNGELVSEDKTFKFTYHRGDTPDYEARFTQGTFFIDGSYEESATGKVANAPVAAAKDWTDGAFKDASTDGIHFVDSLYGGTWRSAEISTEEAHTGTKSLKFGGLYGSVGRKITGLSKNTDYIISFYAKTVLGSASTANVDNLYITDADHSFVKFNAAGTELTYKAAGDAGVIYKGNGSYNCIDEWKKISVDFNSGNNTDIIVWMELASGGATLYLDNFAVSRVPVAFKPAANDANLGFASPAEGIVCMDGDEVTFTATPLEGNIFEGWYVGTKKVSDDLEFTFTYNSSYAGLTARFKAGEPAVANASLETGYLGGQLLAQANHTKNITAADSDWTNQSFLATTKDGAGIYYFDSMHGGTFRNAKATTNYAHTGKFSIALKGWYGCLGRKFTGLKKNTDYTISFYGMVRDNSSASFSNLIITKANETCFTDDGNVKSGGEVIAKSATKYGSFEAWSKATISFNSGDNTDIILWVYHDGLGLIYLDDFAIYEPVSANISAGLGGTVSSSFAGTTVPTNSSVTVTAEPLEGNTFAGWFDASGNKVSDNAKYTFVAAQSFALTAKFEGYNMPPRDLTATLQSGIDGTFENGATNAKVGGWYASDPDFSSGWCSYKVSDKMAYEGTKSLQLYARHRNSILPITGLLPNTDYRMSFYINFPNNETGAEISSLGIIGANEEHLGSASNILVQRKRIEAASGWNKIDLYFNSGDNSSVNFILRFICEMGNDRLFMDNITIHQYDASESLANANFEDGKKYWIGDGSVVTDNGSKVLSLAANESVYQDIAVDAYTTYNVSFKAKGKLTAAALDLAKFDVNVKNYISSVTYKDVNGTKWTEYTFKVYTGVHEALNLAFKAGDGGAMIDNVKCVKAKGNSGSVLENIDFETERFELSSTVNSPYTIYTATGDNDTNVLSGKKSLKFTYNSLTAGGEQQFSEGYLSYQPGIGNNFKVSINYKIAEGSKGGAIKIAPEYTGTYGSDVGFEQSSRNSGWQNVTFFVNNKTQGVFKILISSIAYSTESDFYVDNITISVAPAMVNNESAKSTYCEALYNAIDNEGFESKITKNNWAKLPSTVTRVKGDALKGSYFLRAGKGTHYVLPVTVKAGTEYCFAASVRGTATTKGYIGISTDAKGEVLYANRDEVPASKVEYKSGETGWKRSGFKFTASDSGVAYLVIDVTKGSLDIDSVMLFTTNYGYRYDPNDYTVYVPYDYDNLKSATTVINGGFGEQPYYNVNANGGSNGSQSNGGQTNGGESNGQVANNGSNSPAMGDSLVAPILAVVIAAVSFAVIMLIRKRKEGADTDAQ